MCCIPFCINEEKNMNAILARLADPAPPVRRLAVVALFAAVFSEQAVSRAGLAAVGCCLSHESEVRKEREREKKGGRRAWPATSTSSLHLTPHPVRTSSTRPSPS